MSNEIFSDLWYIPKRNLRVVRITLLNVDTIFKKVIKELNAEIFRKIPTEKNMSSAKTFGGIKKYASRIIKLCGDKQLWYVDSKARYKVKINRIDLYSMASRMAKVVSPEIINNVVRLHEKEKKIVS